MEPFYFGASQKALLGIYQPPKVNPMRRCGIVLCYPIGQEYVRAHRAFRQLALLLVRNGFHVLRFDYYGCGDSAGDFEEADVTQWTRDVAAAIDELKDISGVKKVSLIGARLGASLCALAGSPRTDVDSMVLWDPAMNGKSYLAEVLAWHRKWLEEVWPKSTQTSATNGKLEILGFPFSRGLCDSLERLDLSAVQQWPVQHLLIVESERQTEGALLSQHLKEKVSHLDCLNIPSPRIWVKRNGLEQSLVPSQLLQGIVSWVSKVSL